VVQGLRFDPAALSATIVLLCLVFSLKPHRRMTFPQATGILTTRWLTRRAICARPSDKAARVQRVGVWPVGFPFAMAPYHVETISVEHGEIRGMAWQILFATS